MTDTKHNGWSNYETWNVKLWIDNDQHTHNYWLDQARKFYKYANKGHSITKFDQAKYDLADTLKGSFEEELADCMPGASCFTGLLNAALSQVNWDEIANSFLEANDIAT